jgi:hypothetical protein
MVVTVMVNNKRDMVGNKMATEEMRVECLECGRKFATSNTDDPSCPKCGSTDLDVIRLPIGRAYGSLTKNSSDAVGN